VNFRNLVRSQFLNQFLVIFSQLRLVNIDLIFV